MGERRESERSLRSAHSDAAAGTRESGGCAAGLTSALYDNVPKSGSTQHLVPSTKTSCWHWQGQARRPCPPVQCASAVPCSAAPCSVVTAAQLMNMDVRDLRRVLKMPKRKGDGSLRARLRCAALRLLGAASQFAIVSVADKDL